MADNLAEYYVCFLDLMGQKEYFKDISSTTVDDKIKNNIDRVSNGLREIVRYVKNRYERDFITEDDVGLELFSDSVMLSIRARQGVRFASWLNIIVKIVYIACRYQLPFRGGIARGRGMRSTHASLYGSVVDEAIEIESVQADYPRIVISPFVIQDERVGELLGHYATVDSDSLVVLNYAGNKLLSEEHFERERSERSHICDWVRSCYGAFCFTGEPKHDVYAKAKLARRYRMWLEYLQIESEVRDRHV